MKIETQFEQRLWIIAFSWLVLLIVLVYAVGFGIWCGMEKFAKEFAYQCRTGWRTVKKAWNWRPSP